MNEGNAHEARLELGHLPRDEQMLALRKRGFTLQAIGDEYGISKQRVDQLIGHRYRPPRLRPYKRIAHAVAVAARAEVRREGHHGTRYCYVYYGCRRPECVAAQSEYMRSLKDIDPPSHGVSGYVNYGCRCDICSAAKSVYYKRYYERRKAKAAAS